MVKEREKKRIWLKTKKRLKRRLRLLKSRFAKTPNTPHNLPSRISQTLRKVFSFSTIRWLLFKSLKWGLILSLCLLMILGITLFTASKVLDQDDLNKLVSDVVLDTTGAHFTSEKTTFNLLKGLSFEKIKIYPQKPMGSSTNQPPLLAIEELSLQYDFMKVFFFDLDLKEAQIKQPSIYLSQHEEVWNFQPILDFLERRKESSLNSNQGALDKKEGQQQKNVNESLPPEDNNSTKIIDLIPIHPAKILILPFNMNINRIGFTNFKVHVEQTKTLENQQEQKIVHRFGGLSFTTNIHWRGRKSELALRLGHTGTKPLSILSQTWLNHEEVVSKRLKTSIKMQQSMILKDFDLLTIRGDINVDRINVGELELYDIPVSLNIQMGLLPSLDGIRLDQASFKLLNIVETDTSGSFKLLDGYLDQYEINIDQYFNIDLDKANEMAQLFDLPLSLSGKILSKQFHIEGPIIPNKIDVNLPQGSIPDVNTQVLFTNVFGSLKKEGISTKPLNGEIKLTSSGLAGEPGIQIEMDTDLNLDGAQLKQMVDGQTAEINIKQLKNSISARLSYPSLVVPFFRLTNDIDAATVKMGNEPPITVPVSMEVYGAIGKDLNKISLDTKFDIEDLLDFGLDIRCKNQCNQFKINQHLQLDSFQKLYTFAKPALTKFVPLDLIPKLVEGKLNVQTSIRGQSPNIKEVDIEKILSQTKGQLSMNMNLENFATEIPINHVILKDFNTRLGLSGSFQEQIIDLKKSFSQFSMELSPGTKSTDSQKVIINHFTLDTRVKNQSKLQDGLSDIQKKLATSLTSKMYIGQVHLQGILPKPLNSIGFDVNLDQAKLSTVQLHQLQLEAPDFGAKIKLSGNTHISDKFMPESFKFKTEVDIQHSGGEGIPTGIKTSGRMTVDSEISSTNLKVFQISGMSRFENFNLTVPGKEKGPPLLLVDSVNGDIPLSQSIDISPFMTLMPPALRQAIDGGPSTIQKPTSKKSQEVVEGPLADDPLLQIPDNEAIEKYFSKSTSSLKKETNLVGHLDYLGVKDFYPEHETLTIKKVSAANLNLYDLEFDIQIKQNWISLNQFTIGFLDGKIQGDLRFAFSPIPEELKMSLHLTRLNTTKLIENIPTLKEKAKSWDLFSDPNIDSTVHIHYNMKNDDISGGIDITKIGKEQLKMMLYYLDPEEKNPSLESIKTALKFGNVSHVAIPIKNGTVGLDVGVSVLAIPIPLPSVQTSLQTTLQRYNINRMIQNKLKHPPTVNSKENDEKAKT